MVTKNNFKEPWLRFEAGALAKALDAEVTPVFCNLRLLDVVHTPLEHLSDQADYEVVKAENKQATTPKVPKADIKPLQPPTLVA
jgi:hypothetical protein